jgi:predicted metal-binding transcription factor (methanogenesis marker protein 9)
MPDKPQLDSISRIAIGVAVVVLGALFVWICSSVKTSEMRITVLESQFSRIVSDIEYIKIAQDRSKELSQDTVIAVRELKAILNKQYNPDK